MIDGQTLKSWADEVEFERVGPVRRVLKAVLFNPLANYFPAVATRALLKFGESELAAANWHDPGGWRSMVISYEGRPRQIADKILVKTGTVPTALRNRRRLGARLIAGLIESCDDRPAHVLCLGAGPGHIVTDALRQVGGDGRATLVDISADAFEYGREVAEIKGVTDRVCYIQGDVRDVAEVLGDPPDIVKMIGICEYLDDEEVVSVARAAADTMRPGGTIVFNSISKGHGTDRFFRKVFGLHMNHRSPDELQGLMERAGFADFVALREPLGVYHVIVGQKRV